MIQLIELIGNGWQIKLFFDTQQTNLGDALRLEGERIQKAINDRQSFIENRYRRIFNGRSVICDENGNYYE